MWQTHGEHLIPLLHKPSPPSIRWSTFGIKLHKTLFKNVIDTTMEDQSCVAPAE
jgi:hypothetical protein